MFERLGQTIATRPQPKPHNLKFGPWSDGLVTEYQPEQMKPSQLFESLNMILVGPGVQRTRDGSSLVCTGCTGEIVQVDDIKVGDTWYTIMSDTDNKLYFNDSGTATAIATLDGNARFVGFMGVLIIFDKSYIKQWDGTTVTVLYDNGLGATSPYQVNNRTVAVDDAEDVQLYGAGTTSVELAFTTQDWSGSTAGTYTTSIPPTTAFGNFFKTGSPIGSVEAQITTTAGTETAAVNFTTDVDDFVTTAGGTTTGLEYEAIFLSTDITTELEPDSNYLLKFNYSGGDASNYVTVKHTAADNPKASLKPGKPPKGEWGLVHQDRIHFIEGVDGTNPSYRWYSNAGNQFDYSSSDGGGFTPVVDESGTNYPIGSMASWNDKFWVMGIPRQPFLGLQTGATPSAWRINKTMQNVSGDYKSTVVTPDDIVFLHPSGIDMISSVQESSDIKAESQSDNIRKTIQQYFSNAACAGYDPEWGLYVLKLAGTNDIYIVHTRAKSVKFSGRKGKAFSPVSRWNYAFDDVPTSFGHGDGFMLVGTDLGKVYKMDKNEVEDNDNAITFKTITASLPTIFGEAQAVEIGYKIFGRFGGNCNVTFYKNYSRTSFDSLPFELPIDSTVLTSELTEILTADADFFADPEEYFDREIINFNYRNIMVGFEDIVLHGGPLYFGEINLLSQAIGGM